MLLAIENLPVDIAVLSAYNFFSVKHDRSTKALSALVLNDVAVDRNVAKASTDFGFSLISAEEYVRRINAAVTDRNSLRSLLVSFDLGDTEADREFQRVLLNQIHEYLKVAKQELGDAGVAYSMKPGVGLVLGS